MTSHLIREMDARDREAVVELLGESDPWTTLGYSKDDWNRIFCPIPQGRESYVIELDGRVAGVAIVRQKISLGGLPGIAGHRSLGKRKRPGPEHASADRVPRLRKNEEHVCLRVGLQ